MLSHVAEIFPDFRNNVHSIELIDDNFPSVLERLDSLASATEVKELDLYEGMHIYCIIPRPIHSSSVLRIYSPLKDY
jgi:hypothetical protein